ncbi:MAG TPA: hypothetical protein VFN26_14105 [Candidatus Acidoferrum sp.]|nr:hypothetical protein [Candidatus Acidoferrum sp.]
MRRMIPIDVRREAHRRVCAVLRCLDVLLPDATPARRKHIANRILTMCDGKDRRVRITQEQARELIMPHMQCIAKNCPELVFWEPISRGLNMFFGEEDER